MKKTLVFLFTLLSCLTQAQQGLRFIDSLEKRIENLTDKNQIFSEKATLLLKYYTSGKEEKAQELLRQLQTEAENQKSEFGLATYYNTQGIFFYYGSNFDSSLYYLEKALAIRKKIKDNIGMLKTMSNIAGIHFLLKNYSDALKFYLEGLEKEQELHYEEGQYISLNNLAAIHSALKIHEKALVYYRKAEASYIKHRKADDLIYVYEGISGVYSDLKNYDSALYYANKSRDLAEQLNEVRSIGYASLQIGTIYNHIKKYELARKELGKALELSVQSRDKRLELAAHGNLAVTELENNNMNESFRHIEKVIALQNELQVKSNLEDQPKLFAEYYFAKKEYKTAYEYLRKYIDLADSMYQKDIAFQLNDMRSRYETEKKEKQNELLKSENRTVRTTRNFLYVILALALAAIIGAVIAYKKIRDSKELIGIQKHLVEEKQKEILDSINYAKRIQFALLASDNLLKTHLPDHFVLFRPKDVVSGDFYWGSPVSDGFIYITADCTGHGVPGAFMSLLNISKLSQVINEKGVTRPDEVLNQVRTEIIKALNPAGSEQGDSKDGMDAVLCKLNLKEKKLEFSAANNSFYIIRDKKVLHCKADKMPVGKGHDDNTSFTYNEIALEKGDIIYTFTDGFADQFGGALGKKFKYKQMEELIFSVHQEPMDIQKNKLEEAFDKWKGNLEQVDDVCIIAVKIT